MKIDLKNLYTILKLDTTNYSRWCKNKLSRYISTEDYEITKSGHTTYYMLEEVPYIILTLEELSGPAAYEHIKSLEVENSLVTDLLDINIENNLDYLKEQLFEVYRNKTGVLAGYTMPSMSNIRNLNKVLEYLGFQTYCYVRNRYIPTESGKPYCLARVIRGAEIGLHLIWKLDFIDILPQLYQEKQALTSDTTEGPPLDKAPSLQYQTPSVSKFSRKRPEGINKFKPLSDVSW
jgi:hypothetical protein